MIIFNITYSVDKNTEEKWLLWYKGTHLEKIMKTRAFKSARFCKITSHTQPDSVNYSVQFLSEKKEMLKNFLENHYPIHINDLRKEFSDSVIPFATEMEHLGDF